MPTTSGKCLPQVLEGCAGFKTDGEGDSSFGGDAFVVAEAMKEE
jgi:hypothetical protein